MSHVGLEFKFVVSVMVQRRSSEGLKLYECNRGLVSVNVNLYICIFWRKKITSKLQSLFPLVLFCRFLSMIDLDIILRECGFDNMIKIHIDSIFGLIRGA
jgi:hypothetical protein